MYSLKYAHSILLSVFCLLIPASCLRFDRYQICLFRKFNLKPSDTRCFYVKFTIISSKWRPSLCAKSFPITFAVLYTTDTKKFLSLMKTPTVKKYCPLFFADAFSKGFMRQWIPTLKLSLSQVLVNANPWGRSSIVSGDEGNVKSSSYPTYQLWQNKAA